MKLLNRSQTKSTFPQLFFFLIVGAVLIASSFANHASITEAATTTLEYSIDRTAVPELNYTDLTLIINVSDASSIVVTDGESNLINYKSGPAADEITLTTTSDRVKISLDGITDPTAVGEFRKANLKNNHTWAYSHGFDDNIFLDAERKAFLDREIPATYNLISSSQFVLPEPNEFWSDDFNLEEFYEIVDAGWDINNHTTDHETSDDPGAFGCSDDLSRAERKADVLAAQAEMEALFANSSRPNYKVIGFAIPCGYEVQTEQYPGIIHEIRDDAEGSLLYYEDGGEFPYHMDVSPPFDFDREIYRDSDIDGAGGQSATITGRFDTISTESQQSATPYWYTTFSHGNHFGNNLTALEETLDYLIDTYGINGTDEVWIAPTATVYSYLLVRDKAIVTQTQGPQATATPQTPQPTASATPQTPQPTASAIPQTPQPTASATPQTPQPTASATPQTPQPTASATPQATKSVTPSSSATMTPEVTPDPPQNDIFIYLPLTSSDN